MIKVDYKKAENFLKELDLEEVKNAAAMLLVQDDSGSGADAQLLTLDYGIIKEKNTTAGEGHEDIKEGKFYLPDSPSANGQSVYFPDGIPFYLIARFKQREFEGSAKDGESAECGTPIIETMIQDKLVSLGGFGYKFGDCADCPKNTFEANIKIQDKCLPLNKFLILTAIPDPDNPEEYIPVPVQFKGKSTRAKPLKNELIGYVQKCGGKVHSWIGKMTTEKTTGKSTEGKDYTVHQFKMKPVVKLKLEEDAMKAHLDVMRKFKDTIFTYYILQHQMRTQRNNAIESEAAAARLEHNAGTAAIEHKPVDVDAKTGDIDL